MTNALLVNWFDLAPGAEAAFDGWHNREHVIERLGVPGFTRGRRFVSLDSSPQTGHAYLVIYDAESLSTFESPEYGRRLDSPTPLTRQVVPLLRDLTRTVYEVCSSKGGGEGGYFRTVRLRGPAASHPPLDEIGRNLQAAYDCESVTAVSLGRPDRKVTHYKDSTQEGRATETLARAEYPCAVLIEACRPDALDAATRVVEDALRARFPGWPVECDVHSYQLVFAMSSGQAPG